MRSRDIVLDIYTLTLRETLFKKEKALKDCLWKATRVTYLKEFKDAMNEMKGLSTDAP